MKDGKPAGGSGQQGNRNQRTSPTGCGTGKSEALVRSSFAHQYLRQEDVAEFLAVSVRTLEAWRLSGEGPLYVRLGRKKAVRYKREELEAFLAARTFRSTSEETAWDTRSQ